MARPLLLLVVFWWSLCGEAQAAEFARAGALQHGDKWEIGVAFDEQVNLSSALSLSKYLLSHGTIQNLRVFPKGKAVVITASGLAPGMAYGLTITNLTDTGGEELPTAQLSFNTGIAAWTVVGAQELGFVSDAMAFGDEGYDLVSGGSQLWNRYDEATFVYEQIEGDFDRKVRLDCQEPSSAWARAGLMARESLDTGRPRPENPFEPSQAFSRYIEIHATPPTTATGTAGANTHEVNVRYYLGGIGHPQGVGTENPPLQNNAAPAYTNAWLRLVRSGQTFHAFRAEDKEGTNWVQLGTFVFPNDPPLANKLYVGVSYCPENLNIPLFSGARGEFLARFRGFQTAEGPAMDLSVRRGENGNIEVHWRGGVLQDNPVARLEGWNDVEGVSPLRIAPSGQRYYRLRSP